MLENLKQMCQQEFFKRLPCDINLDNIIKEAKTYEDIEPYIDTIKLYIKDAINDIESNHIVTIGKTICDFYDKFSYELYEMYLAPASARSNVHTKEFKYGNAGPASLGLRSSDIKFSLCERKLMKIINHHFITLKADDYYRNEDFFVPYDHLKLMFSDGINHQVVKETIIETCNRISEKEVFWDFKSTKYAKTKHLTVDGLESCKGDKLVDITIVYQPRTKQSATMKGIICRVNKFMKLRYALKQINNYFPTTSLRRDYLDFVIADRLLYHMNLQRGSKINYKIDLSKLAKQIYAYKDKEQLTRDLYNVIGNDDHKPAQQLYYLRALSNVAEDYSTNMSINYRFNLHIDNGIIIPLLTNYNSSRNPEHIINEIKIAIHGKDDLQRIFRYMNLKDKDLSVYDKIMSISIIDKKIKQRYLDEMFNSNDSNNIEYLERLKNELVSDIKGTKIAMYDMMNKGRILLVISTT